MKNLLSLGRELGKTELSADDVAKALRPARRRATPGPGPRRRGVHHGREDRQGPRLGRPVRQRPGQGTTLDTTTRQTAAITTALSGLGGTAEATATSIDITDKSVNGYEGAAGRAEQATYDLNTAFGRLMGTLDQEEKWDAWSKAVWNLADGAGDTAAETREWKRETAELVMGLEGIAQLSAIISSIVAFGSVARVVAVMVSAPFSW